MTTDFAPTKKPKRIMTKLVLACILFFAVVQGVNYLLLPPKTFPVPYHIVIEPGQSLFSLSTELYTDGAISSQRVFEILMISLGSEHHIAEGEYSFSQPLSVVDMAFRISGRQFGISRKKITFPEGFSIKEMSVRLATSLTNFDTIAFTAKAMPLEGYLFPSTYSFFPSVTSDDVIQTMQNTFATETATLQQHAIETHKKWSDIVIMASIIEKEAAGESDRGIVSGILWNRLQNNMALQVDAPFLYLLGKKSSELTHTDLNINSPYNTYKNTGLPPTPINNPGLAALTAALYPVDSSYVFYLHDANGNIHYATTYAEHQKNIKQYLK